MSTLKPSNTELQNRRTRAIISYGMDKQGLTNADLAKAAGITERTVRKRRQYPETLTMFEMRAWCRILKLDEKQQAQLIGVQE